MHMYQPIGKGGTLKNQIYDYDDSYFVGPMIPALWSPKESCFYICN